MKTLQWSSSHAVFVTEIDDEHKEIFQAVADLQAGLHPPQANLQELTGRLIASVNGHFAHEERLMRAARYESLRWHKRLHEAARRRVVELVHQLEQGDPEAGRSLVAYLTDWLPSHTRIADRMMAAALRNHRRGMYRMYLHASTRPVDSCEWVDVNGRPFEPS